LPLTEEESRDSLGGSGSDFWASGGSGGSGGSGNMSGRRGVTGLPSDSFKAGSEWSALHSSKASSVGSNDVQQGRVSIDRKAWLDDLNAQTSSYLDQYFDQ
jgi:hypothetical protein